MGSPNLKFPARHWPQKGIQMITYIGICFRLWAAHPPFTSIDKITHDLLFGDSSDLSLWLWVGDVYTESTSFEPSMQFTN